MKNTSLIIPALFAAWLLWIAIRPNPLERSPRYAAPGVTKIKLPGSGQELLIVREANSSIKVRDVNSWEALADLGKIPTIDSLFFQNDSIYFRVFSVRDSLTYTIRYGVDELQPDQ